jgi:hypothetical protein
MPNGKHLATSQRVAKAWRAWDPEQLPRPAGQPVVEDALEAAVSRLRKRRANAAAGMQVGTKRGLGRRLVIGEDR